MLKHRDTNKNQYNNFNNSPANMFGVFLYYFFLLSFLNLAFISHFVCIYFIKYLIIQHF